MYVLVIKEIAPVQKCDYSKKRLYFELCHRVGDIAIALRVVIVQVKQKHQLLFWVEIGSVTKVVCSAQIGRDAESKGPRKDQQGTTPG